MTDALWIVPAVVATGLAWIAYRIGYHRARPPFPDELRADLACHKRECLGETAPRVERELTLFLGPPRGSGVPGARVTAR